MNNSACLYCTLCSGSRNHCTYITYLQIVAEICGCSPIATKPDAHSIDLTLVSSFVYALVPNCKFWIHLVIVINNKLSESPTALLAVTQQGMVSLVPDLPQQASESDEPIMESDGFGVWRLCRLCRKCAETLSKLCLGDSSKVCVCVFVQRRDTHHGAQKSAHGKEKQSCKSHQKSNLPKQDSVNVRTHLIIVENISKRCSTQ